MEAFHEAQEREDFVLPIGMAMNPALALQNFADRFEFEIAADRTTIGVRNLVQILLRRGKAVGEERADTHARTRKAGAALGAGLLYVFAERELDAGRRAREFHFVRRSTVAELDDAILSADRIR